MRIVPKNITKDQLTKEFLRIENSGKIEIVYNMLVKYKVPLRSEKDEDDRSMTYYPQELPKDQLYKFYLELLNIN